MNIVHVLEVIFAFSFMIAIHEWGHFIAMRLMGVGVEEYCLGFPPRLISRKWGKTTYSIGVVPLGGFCKPQGGDMSGEAVEEMYATPPKPGDYLAAAWWKRIFILLAGPGMNLISAFIIIALLFITMGEPISHYKPVLGFVAPGTLAESAGLKSGDVVVKIDGKPTSDFNDISKRLPNPGKSVDLVIERSGKTVEKTLTRPPLSGDRGTEPSWGIVESMPAVVGEALIGQPARNSGIQDGDELVFVNGRKPMDWSEFSYLIRNTKADPLQLEIKRDGKLHAISIARIFNGQFMAIGVTPPLAEKQVDYEKVPVGQAVLDAWATTWGRCGNLLNGIGMLVTGKVSLKDSVGGPITIMRMMYKRATEKWVELINIVAMISLILFLMNLLPLGVVDGGQILLCLIEGIKRSPVSIKIQIRYQQVGFALVIGLMSFAVFNDLKNLFLEMHNHIK